MNSKNSKTLNTARFVDDFSNENALKSKKHIFDLLHIKFVNLIYILVVQCSISYQEINPNLPVMAVPCIASNIGKLEFSNHNLINHGPNNLYPYNFSHLNTEKVIDNHNKNTDTNYQGVADDNIILKDTPENNIIPTNDLIFYSSNYNSYTLPDIYTSQNKNQGNVNAFQVLADLNIPILYWNTSNVIINTSFLPLEKSCTENVSQGQYYTHGQSVYQNNNCHNTFNTTILYPAIKNYPINNHGYKWSNYIYLNNNKFIQTSPNQRLQSNKNLRNTIDESHFPIKMFCDTNNTFVYKESLKNCNKSNLPVTKYNHMINQTLFFSDRNQNNLSKIQLCNAATLIVMKILHVKEQSRFPSNTKRRDEPTNVCPTTEIQKRQKENYILTNYKYSSHLKYIKQPDLFMSQLNNCLNHFFISCYNDSDHLYFFRSDILYEISSFNSPDAIKFTLFVDFILLILNRINIQILTDSLLGDAIKKTFTDPKEHEEDTNYGFLTLLLNVQNNLKYVSNIPGASSANNSNPYICKLSLLQKVIFYIFKKEKMLIEDEFSYILEIYDEINLMLDTEIYTRTIKCVKTFTIYNRIHFKISIMINLHSILLDKYYINPNTVMLLSLNIVCIKNHVNLDEIYSSAFIRPSCKFFDNFIRYIIRDYNIWYSAIFDIQSYNLGNITSVVTIRDVIIGLCNYLEGCKLINMRINTKYKVHKIAQTSDYSHNNFFAIYLQDLLFKCCEDTNRKGNRSYGSENVINPIVCLLTKESISNIVQIMSQLFECNDNIEIYLINFSKNKPICEKFYSGNNMKTLSKNFVAPFYLFIRLYIENSSMLVNQLQYNNVLRFFCKCLLNQNLWSGMNLHDLIDLFLRFLHSDLGFVNTFSRIMDLLLFEQALLFCASKSKIFLEYKFIKHYHNIYSHFNIPGEYLKIHQFIIKPIKNSKCSNPDKYRLFYAFDYNGEVSILCIPRIIN